MVIVENWRREWDEKPSVLPEFLSLYFNDLPESMMNLRSTNAQRFCHR